MTFVAEPKGYDVNRRAAETVLGLIRPYTFTDVIRAYAHKVRQVHPDTAEVGAQASDMLARYKQARDNLRTGMRPCPLCRGEGTVRGVSGPVVCKRCGGEGYVEDV